MTTTSSIPCAWAGRDAACRAPPASSASTIAAPTWRSRLGEAAPGTRGELLDALNALNGSYRWLKLSLDEAGALQCTTDIFLVPEVAGLFGIAGMGMMFDMLDEIYPRLAPYLR